VLGDLGIGIGKFVKSTKDMDAANRIAQARMQGTAGALEQLRGSWETAQLRFGQLIAPHVVRVADELTRALNGQSPAFNTLVDAVRPAASLLRSVASLVRGIPGPLIAAGFAMAAIGKASSFAGPKLAAFGNNIRTARQGAGLFRSSLTGITGMFGGPWGLALAGAGAALGAYAARQAAAKARVNGLTATLNKQTFAITRQTRAMVVSNLESSGMLKKAREMGLSLKDVVDSALGNEAAQKRLNVQLSTYQRSVVAATRGTRASGIAGSDARARIDLFRKSLGTANAELRAARQAALRTAAAMGTLASARQRAMAGLTKSITRSGVAPEIARGTAGKLTAIGASATRTGAGTINVTVNNPRPERASESTPTAIARATRAAGWAAA
jgi:hypothetical protein